ncbi:hypothetical protein [Magnetospirillum aberrantis]|uniref:Uncharacterized protein n=1 Tax=Magnetospirillum aberrantis SpK TaxID=908842 RepID=A0A7C9UXE9_9PROT|nr:hypothetical protein [Magnetospirillum aberrantis]NFV79071.1 hypothetical protein [Magnetospirillum aberrantis SpK]
MLVEDYRLTRKRFRILTESFAKLTPSLDLDRMLRGGEVFAATDIASSTIDRRQLEALDRVISTLRDVEKINRAGLMIDDGDVVGRGLRETIAEDRDIALLEQLFATLRSLQ